MRIKKAFILAVTSVFLYACKSEATRMEEEIKKSFSDAKNNINIKEIDFSKFTSNKIHKICIQGPYSIKKYLEKEAERELEGFSEFDDKSNYYSIWLLFEAGKSLEVKINTTGNLKYSYESQKSCSKSTIIIVDHQNSTFNFYSEEK